MSRVWDDMKIIDALAIVQREGKAIVVLPSHRDAINFRLAVYNYRRVKGAAQRLKLEVSGADVIISYQEPLKGPIMAVGRGRS